MNYPTLKTIIANAQETDLDSVILMGDHITRSDLTQEQKQTLMALLRTVPLTRYVFTEYSGEDPCKK